MDINFYSWLYTGYYLNTDKTTYDEKIKYMEKVIAEPQNFKVDKNIAHDLINENNIIFCISYACYELSLKMFNADKKSHAQMLNNIKTQHKSLVDGNDYYQKILLIAAYGNVIDYELDKKFKKIIPSNLIVTKLEPMCSNLITKINVEARDVAEYSNDIISYQTLIEGLMPYIFRIIKNSSKMCINSIIFELGKFTTEIFKLILIKIYLHSNLQTYTDPYWFNSILEEQSDVFEKNNLGGIYYFDPKLVLLIQSTAMNMQINNLHYDPFTNYCNALKFSNPFLLFGTIDFKKGLNNYNTQLRVLVGDYIQSFFKINCRFCDRGTESFKSEIQNLSLGPQSNGVDLYLYSDNITNFKKPTMNSGDGEILRLYRTDIHYFYDIFTEKPIHGTTELYDVFYKNIITYQTSNINGPLIERLKTMREKFKDTNMQYNLIENCIEVYGLPMCNGKISPDDWNVIKRSINNIISTISSYIALNINVNLYYFGGGEYYSELPKLTTQTKIDKYIATTNLYTILSMLKFDGVAISNIEEFKIYISQTDSEYLKSKNPLGLLEIADESLVSDFINSINNDYLTINIIKNMKENYMYQRIELRCLSYSLYPKEGVLPVGKYLYLNLLLKFNVNFIGSVRIQKK